jgi:hypothetical protein
MSSPRTRPIAATFAVVAVLLTTAPMSLAAMPTLSMSPTIGPIIGGTVVEISGGSGYSDSTRVSICGISVIGVASKAGTSVKFATPAAPPWCPSGPVAVTTSNPGTDGLPPFTYVATVVPGPSGLTGTVRSADGTPRAGVAMWILRTFDEGIIATTTTNSDGTYLLPAPADHYIEAVAQDHDPYPIPDGSPTVYREVQYFNLDIAAGATTLRDWVLPSLSMKGICTKSICKVHESIRGFNPLEPVKVYLQSGDVAGFGQLLLGTVTTDETGAADDSFTFAKPDGAGRYYTTAGPGDFPSYGKSAVSSGLLQVP